MKRWFAERGAPGAAEIQYNVLSEQTAPQLGLRERTARGMRGVADVLRRVGTIDAQPGGFGAAFAALDWERVRADVLQDCRARIHIAGSNGAGKSTLLAFLHGLHGASLDAPPLGIGAEDFGLFDATGVVTDAADGAGWAGQIAPADLTIWLLDARAGVRRGDLEALGRLRSTGRPLLAVLNKIDAPDACIDAAAAAQATGGRIVPIAAATGEGVLERLLPAVVDACPSLALALGREVPAFRAEAVRCVTQRAAALSGMSGFEANPLLDVPNSAAVQMQLVMRIGAVYGEAPNDRYSREMLAVVVASMLVRGAAALLFRSAPLLGGVAFQGISAGVTYGLGRAANAYFRNGRSWRRRAVRDSARDSVCDAVCDAVCEGGSHGTAA
ncbi:MAG: DUF697 domain-containing protein [Chloroflexi bacterium]|nr:DUF697 domain-containing protein [Chloroflexota bacterium]